MQNAKKIIHRIAEIQESSKKRRIFPQAHNQHIVLGKGSGIYICREVEGPILRMRGLQWWRLARAGAPLRSLLALGGKTLAARRRDRTVAQAATVTEFLLVSRFQDLKRQHIYTLTSSGS